MDLLRWVSRAWRRPPGPPPDAMLVLRRPGRRLGPFGRAWLVEMDGARLTRLRSGSERQVPVPSGRHRLNLWAGDVGSLPLTVTMAPGETVTVEAMTMKRATRLGIMDPAFAPDPLLFRRVS